MRSICALIASMLLAPGTMLAAELQVVMPAQHRAFFQQYCIDCHSADDPEQKVRLDDLPFALDSIPVAERWQKVLNVLNSGEMPPRGEKQPADVEKAEFLDDLSQAMVAVRKKLSDSGGRITMRRLNKREYENTMRDLLGVDVDARELPNDGGGGTLDTVGNSLFFSSDQFEQYLAIARKALDAAIVTGPRPETKKQRVEPEVEANKRVAGILRGYYMGGYRTYKLWKASNGRPPSEFGLVDGREMDFRKQVWERNAPAFIDYLTRPETQTGALLTIAEPNPQVGIAVPDDAPAGDYLIRARVGVAPKMPAHRRFMEIGLRVERADGPMNVLACQRVTGTLAKPQIVELILKLPKSTKPTTAGVGPQAKVATAVGERVVAFRERQFNSREAAFYQHFKSLEETGFGIEPALWLDWVEWEGPVEKQWPPVSHSRLFFKDSQAAKDDAYAREIVARFAQRAFRGREVRSSYLDRLMQHYSDRRAAGESFEEALKEPLGIVLASPSFIYIAEPSGEKGTKRELSAIELANRLAYFLWSAPPDETLYELARNGELLRPAVLARQVDRMLDDPKCWEFVRGFTYQWLSMERLSFFQFNYRLYPEFDDSVKLAARDEVFHTINTVLRGRLGLGTLLKSDFVVINDLLAEYYGIEGVRGAEFRRVKVPAQMPRGGFLGMAAILAMGSDGERSSPVERGAWVMRKLLHRPPPPAPANVPQLSRHAGKLLSARELLTAHMEEPQCAQCHRKLDPLGYGLENFDAVGRWRAEEYIEIAKNNRVSKSKLFPIDPTGTLPDGTPFQDFFELREAVAKHEEAFARGLIERLIEYALGRPFGFSDEDLAGNLLVAAKKKDFELRVIIHALVASQPFHTK